MKKNNLSDRVVEYLLTLDIKGFENINVNNIAHKFKVNRCYLSQKFKDDKNFALNDYIITIKILRAATLLASSDEVTTEELAKAMGYSNTQYFCCLFKNRMGTTPGKYKNLIKKAKG